MCKVAMFGRGWISSLFFPDFLRLDVSGRRPTVRHARRGFRGGKIASHLVLLGRIRCELCYLVYESVTVITAKIVLR